MRSITRAFTSSSSHVKCAKFWHCSRYEQVTPPAFAYTSGMMMMPLSAKMRSAVGVSGPFAPSTTNVAFILFASSSPTASPSAHGMTMSQSRAKTAVEPATPRATTSPTPVSHTLRAPSRNALSIAARSSPPAE